MATLLLRRVLLYISQRLTSLQPGLCRIQLATLALGVILIAHASAQNGPQTASPAPPRDTRGQPREAPVPGKGRISGRIVAADTTRPLRRARVVLAGGDQPGRTVLTDDDGRFSFVELPAGVYRLNVSRAGFITVAYGQRRPLQPGTPIQLADAQELTNVDVSLPRGSVLTGHVYDETGEPLPGATVRVHRYAYVQGVRQLAPAGAGDTDDRGEFRIWGLNPGEYLVSAASRALNLNGRGGAGPGAAAAAVLAGRGRGGPGNTQVTGAVDPSAGGPPVTYADTYYPGVPSPESAQIVTVGLSAEVQSLDFSLLLVRTSRITGRATTADGSPLAQANIALAPAGGGGRDLGRPPLSAPVAGDGSFTLANVPPGRYVLRARAGRREAPLYAEQPLTVAEGDLANVLVVVSPGGSLSGTVSFRGSPTPPREATQVRIEAPAVDPTDLGRNPAVRIDADGRFTLDAVSPGAHWIRAQPGIRGWTLASVLLNGRETIDSPVDVKGGQAIGGLVLTFTDRLTEINGTLSDSQSRPVPDFTVLAFPTDATLWRPQSRHIVTTRPDQNGKYQLRGLPPGDYFVVPIDPAQPGEWYDAAFLELHQQSAARISLNEGETKTQDFKLAPQ